MAAQSVTSVASAAAGTARWLGRRLDPVGNPTAGLETVAVLDSYGTSLMPRTSVHQGLATGLHVLGARLIGSRVTGSYPSG